MPQVERYGSGQFNTMLEQRDHDDKFISDIIQFGAKFDKDIADFIRDDIMTGNTATIRNHYKKLDKVDFYKPLLYDGTLFPDGPGGSEIVDHTLFGMSPIKDDYSTAQGAAGYHGLADGDDHKEATIDALDSLNMDAMDVAAKVLEPEAIGAIGSTEFKPYQKAWDDSPTLQAEYPTIEQYHSYLVNAHQQQVEGMDTVTDAFVGLCVTGDSLAEYNTVALYYTLSHIFPLITYNGQNYEDIENFPAQSYMYEFVSGYFHTVNGWHGWSHIIREGIVENDFDDGSVKYYRAKSNYEFYTGDEAKIDMSDGDPIVEILQPNVLEENNWSDAKLRNRANGLLEIHVQLPRRNGVNVYGEIRIWDYGTLHAITADGGDFVALLSTMEGLGGSSNPSLGIPSQSTLTVPDEATAIGQVENADPNYSYTMNTDWGDGGGFSVDDQGNITSVNPLDYATANVYWIRITIDDYLTEGSSETTQTITINVENTNSEPEPPERIPPSDIDVTDSGPNLVFFPLEYEAAREIPFFKRERFLRESVQLCIYNVEEVELEWYQTTAFKVAIFVVALIIALYTGYVDGMYIAMTMGEAIITTAFELVMTGLVLQAIGAVASNLGFEELAIIILIAGAIYTSTIDFEMSFKVLSDVANMAMEATNTLIKSYWSDKMKELEDKMRELQEKMKAAELELEELIEAAGGIMRSDSADWITYASSLVTAEATSSTMDRTTNVDNAIINDVGDNTDVSRQLFIY